MDLRYHPEGDVTQFFGENPALYAEFDMDGHNGIDLVRPWGEHLYATEAGIVISVKENPHGYGKNVRILGNEKDENGYQNQIVYGHNSQNLVKVGDKVFAGQMIALMGNTGFTVSGSTPYWNSNPYAGTHVHFGIRKAKLDGAGYSYEGSDIKMKVIDYNNGYKGSIDPLPYLQQVENQTDRAKMLTIISLLNQVINLYKKLLG